MANYNKIEFDIGMNYSLSDLQGLLTQLEQAEEHFRSLIQTGENLSAPIREANKQCEIMVSSIEGAKRKYAEFIQTGITARDKTGIFTGKINGRDVSVTDNTLSGKDAFDIFGRSIARVNASGFGGEDSIEGIYKAAMSIPTAVATALEGVSGKIMTIINNGLDATLKKERTFFDGVQAGSLRGTIAQITANALKNKELNNILRTVNAGGANISTGDWNKYISSIIRTKLPRELASDFMAMGSDFGNGLTPGKNLPKTINGLLEDTIFKNAYKNRGYTPPAATGSHAEDRVLSKAAVGRIKHQMEQNDIFNRALISAGLATRAKNGDLYLGKSDGTSITYRDVQDVLATEVWKQFEDRARGLTRRAHAPGEKVLNTRSAITKARNPIVVNGIAQSDTFWTQDEKEIANGEAHKIATEGTQLFKSVQSGTANDAYQALRFVSSLLEDRGTDKRPGSFVQRGGTGQFFGTTKVHLPEKPKLDQIVLRKYTPFAKGASGFTTDLEKLAEEGMYQMVPAQNSTANRMINNALEALGRDRMGDHRATDEIGVFSLEGYDSKNPEMRKQLRELYATFGKNGNGQYRINRTHGFEADIGFVKRDVYDKVESTYRDISDIIFGPGKGGSVWMSFLEDKDLFREAIMKYDKTGELARLYDIDPVKGDGSQLYAQRIAEVKKQATKVFPALGKIYDMQGKLYTPTMDYDPYKYITEEEYLKLPSSERAKYGKSSIWDGSQEAGGVTKYKLGGVGRVAIVDMSKFVGGEEREYANGMGFADQSFWSKTAQARMAFAGKGSLMSMPDLRKMAELSFGVGPTGVISAPSIFDDGKTRAKLGADLAEAIEAGDTATANSIRKRLESNPTVKLFDPNNGITTDAFVDASFIKNIGAFAGLTPDQIATRLTQLTELAGPAAVAEYIYDNGTGKKNAFSIGDQMARGIFIGRERAQLQANYVQKLFQELETDEGIMKYVLPSSSSEGLSQRIAEQGGSRLLDNYEVRRKVAEYKNTYLSKLSNGEFIPIGDEEIQNIRFLQNPFYASLMMGGADEKDVMDAVSLLDRMTAGDKDAGKQFKSLSKDVQSRATSLRVKGKGLIDTMLSIDSKGVALGDTKQGFDKYKRNLENLVGAGYFDVGSTPIDLKEFNGEIATAAGGYNVYKFLKDFTLQNGNAIDFSNPDQLMVTASRAPTGTGQYVTKYNSARLFAPLFRNLGIKTEGTMFSLEDLAQMSGADLDGDMAKRIINRALSVNNLRYITGEKWSENLGRRIAAMTQNFDENGVSEFTRTYGDRMKKFDEEIRNAYKTYTTAHVGSEDYNAAYRFLSSRGFNPLSLTDKSLDTYANFDQSLAQAFARTVQVDEKMRASKKEKIRDIVKTPQGMTDAEINGLVDDPENMARMAENSLQARIMMGFASGASTRLTKLDLSNPNNERWYKAALAANSLYDVFTTNHKKPFDVKIDDIFYTANGLGKEFGKTTDLFNDSAKIEVEKQEDGTYRYYSMGEKDSGKEIDPSLIYQSPTGRLFRKDFALNGGYGDDKTRTPGVNKLSFLSLGLRSFNNDADLASALSVLSVMESGLGRTFSEDYSGLLNEIISESGLFNGKDESSFARELSRISGKDMSSLERFVRNRATFLAEEGGNTRLGLNKAEAENQLRLITETEDELDRIVNNMALRSSGTDLRRGGLLRFSTKEPGKLLTSSDIENLTPDDYIEMKGFSYLSKLKRDFGLSAAKAELGALEVNVGNRAYQQYQTINTGATIDDLLARDWDLSKEEDRKTIAAIAHMSGTKLGNSIYSARGTRSENIDRELARAEAIRAAVNLPEDVREFYLKEAGFGDLLAQEPPAAQMKAIDQPVKKLKYTKGTTLSRGRSFRNKFTEATIPEQIVPESILDQLFRFDDEAEPAANPIKRGTVPQTPEEIESIAIRNRMEAAQAEVNARKEELDRLQSPSPTIDSKIEAARQRINELQEIKYKQQDIINFDESMRRHGGIGSGKAQEQLLEFTFADLANIELAPREEIIKKQNALAYTQLLTEQGHSLRKPKVYLPEELYESNPYLFNNVKYHELAHAAMSPDYKKALTGVMTSSDDYRTTELGQGEEMVADVASLAMMMLTGKADGIPELSLGNYRPLQMAERFWGKIGNVGENSSIDHSYAEEALSRVRTLLGNQKGIASIDTIRTAYDYLLYNTGKGKFAKPGIASAIGDLSNLEEFSRIYSISREMDHLAENDRSMMLSENAYRELLNNPEKRTGFAKMQFDFTRGMLLSQARQSDRSHFKRKNTGAVNLAAGMFDFQWGTSDILPTEEYVSEEQKKAYETLVTSLKQRVSSNGTPEQIAEAQAALERAQKQLDTTKQEEAEFAKYGTSKGRMLFNSWLAGERPTTEQDWQTLENFIGSNYAQYAVARGTNRRIITDENISAIHQEAKSFREAHGTGIKGNDDLLKTKTQMEHPGEPFADHLWDDWDTPTTPPGSPSFLKKRRSEEPPTTPPTPPQQPPQVPPTTHPQNPNPPAGGGNGNIPPTNNQQDISHLAISATHVTMSTPEVNIAAANVNLGDKAKGVNDLITKMTNDIASANQAALQNGTGTLGNILGGINNQTINTSANIDAEQLARSQTIGEEAIKQATDARIAQGRIDNEYYTFTGLGWNQAQKYYGGYASQIARGINTIEVANDNGQPAEELITALFGGEGSGLPSFYKKGANSTQKVKSSGLIESFLRSSGYHAINTFDHVLEMQDRALNPLDAASSIVESADKFFEQETKANQEIVAWREAMRRTFVEVQNEQIRRSNATLMPGETPQELYTTDRSEPGRYVSYQDTRTYLNAGQRKQLTLMEERRDRISDNMVGLYGNLEERYNSYADSRAFSGVHNLGLEQLRADQRMLNGINSPAVNAYLQVQQERLQLTSQLHNYQLDIDARQKEYNAAQRQANALTQNEALEQQALDKLNTAQDEMRQGLTVSTYGTEGEEIQDTIARLDAEYAKAANETQKSNIAANSLDFLRIGLNATSAAAEKTRDALRDVSSESAVFDRSLKNVGNSINNIISRYASMFLRKFIRNVATFVKQFEVEMAQIQAITLKTDSQMDDVKSKTLDTAYNLKTTTTQVSKVESALYRQGLSDAQVEEGTEAILKFSAVTGVDGTKAVKQLTAAVKTGLVGSFKEAMDALVALGDTAATTAEEIAKGMQKSAASAKNAGLNYSELTALLAIGTEKTQLGGTQIGNSLSTMMMRMRKVTNEGYTSASNDTYASINDVETALRNVGITLRSDAGTFRDFLDVFTDVASVWQDLTDIQKYNVAYTMAGTRQSNTFMTYMEAISEDGGEQLKKYIDTARNSSGVTDQKYEVITNTLVSSTQQLKAAFDALITPLTETGSLLGKVVGGLASVLKLMSNNTLSKILGTGGVLAGLVTLPGILKGLVSSLTSGASLAVTVGPVVSAVIPYILAALASAAVISLIKNAIDKNSIENKAKRANEGLAATTESSAQILTKQIDKLDESSKIISKINSGDYANMTLDEAKTKNYISENQYDYIIKLFNELGVSISPTTIKISELAKVIENLGKSADRAKKNIYKNQIENIDTKAYTPATGSFDAELSDFKMFTGIRTSSDYSIMPGYLAEIRDAYGKKYLEAYMETETYKNNKNAQTLAEVIPTVEEQEKLNPLKTTGLTLNQQTDVNNVLALYKTPLEKLGFSMDDVSEYVIENLNGKGYVGEQLIRTVYHYIYGLADMVVKGYTPEQAMATATDEWKYYDSNGNGYVSTDYAENGALFRLRAKKPYNRYAEMDPEEYMSVYATLQRIKESGDKDYPILQEEEDKILEAYDYQLARSMPDDEELGRYLGGDLSDINGNKAYKNAQSIVKSGQKIATDNILKQQLAAYMSTVKSLDEFYAALDNAPAIRDKFASVLSSEDVAQAIYNVETGASTWAQLMETISESAGAISAASILSTDAINLAMTAENKRILFDKIASGKYTKNELKTYGELTGYNVAYLTPDQIQATAVMQGMMLQNQVESNAAASGAGVVTALAGMGVDLRRLEGTSLEDINMYYSNLMGIPDKGYQLIYDFKTLGYSGKVSRILQAGYQYDPNDKNKIINANNTESENGVYYQRTPDGRWVRYDANGNTADKDMSSTIFSGWGISDAGYKWGALEGSYAGNTFDAETKAGTYDVLNNRTGLNMLYDMMLNYDSSDSKLDSFYLNLINAIDNSGYSDMIYTAINSSEELKNLFIQLEEGSIGAAEAIKQFEKYLGRTPAEAVKLQKSLNQSAQTIGTINRLLQTETTAWNTEDDSGKKPGDEIAKMLGYDDYENMTSLGIDAKKAIDMLNGLKAAEEYTLTETLNDMIGENGWTFNEEFEINPELSINGSITNNNLNDLISEGLLTAEQAAYLNQFDINGHLEYTTELDENGNPVIVGKRLVIDSSTIKKGSIGSTGTRSGGSSKNKRIEKIERGLEVFKHRVNMVSAEAERFKNSGELTNYGAALRDKNEENILYQQKLREGIIEANEELAKQKAGSDEYYEILKKIFGWEEEIEKTTNDIENNTRAIEENEDAIRKTKIAVQEAIRAELEAQKKAQRDMLAAQIQVENEIIESIKKRYQDEWDLQKKDIDNKKKALEEEKNLINERLNARKNAENEALKQEELNEYKRQLAIIETDPTRTKDAAELRKKIRDIEKELSDASLDRQAEIAAQTIDDQIAAYDDIEKYEEDKLATLLEDANNFNVELNNIMQLSQEDMLKWLSDNSETFRLSTAATQQQMIDSWTDTYNQMIHFTEMWYEKIAEVMQSKESFIEFMKTSDEYQNADDIGRETFLFKYNKLWDDYISAYKNDNYDFAHSDNYSSGISGDINSNSDAVKENTETIKKASNTIEKLNSSFNISSWNKILTGSDGTVDNVSDSISQILNKSTDGGSGVKAYIDSLINKTTHYATGGLVDYTGLAWLDGSVSNPEYVLSAQQYRNLMKFSYSGYRSSLSGGFGDSANTIGEVNITINEASIASDADVNELAERVGEAFREQLSINGFNTRSI